MIIGIKYGHMHVGFTYPSIMSAFRNHCMELLNQDKFAFRLFIKFLWGIKICDIDKLENEFLEAKKFLEKSNSKLSDDSYNFLEDSEKIDFASAGKVPLNYFCAVETDFQFIDLFIETLQTVKEEKIECMRIGSMALNRPELIEEYGWDYPNKIPEEIRKL